MEQIRRQKPSMILAETCDDEGRPLRRSIVRVDSLKEATERRQQSLPPDLEQRAEALFQRVRIVFRGPKSLADWLDGFLFDMHPDREIASWERIADVADEIWAANYREFSKIDKATLLRIVTCVSTGTVDIPSQIEGATDIQVAMVKARF